MRTNQSPQRFRLHRWPWCRTWLSNRRRKRSRRGKLCKNLRRRPSRFPRGTVRSLPHQVARRSRRCTKHMQLDQLHEKKSRHCTGCRIAILRRCYLCPRSTKHRRLIHQCSCNRESKGCTRQKTMRPRSPKKSLARMRHIPGRPSCSKSQRDRACSQDQQSIRSPQRKELTELTQWCSQMKWQTSPGKPLAAARRCRLSWTSPGLGLLRPRRQA